jgi:hypothetical protein
MLLAPIVSAQITSSSNPKVPLTSSDTRVAAITPGAVSVPIQFTVDPASGGGDFFDVVSSHAGAVISLIVPGGAEINSLNAAAQGYSFEIITTEDEDNLSGSVFDLPGTHSVIGLASSAPPGVYQIKIDGTAVTGDHAVIASYYSSSSVRAVAVTDAGTYRVGDTVIVSAIILDGSTPVTGATVSASVGDVSQTTLPSTQVTLQDSGQYDEAPGDGIYTGSFTAGQSGEFTTRVTATGISSTGMSFSRTAGTTFRVLPSLASFISFSDAGIDDNGNGLIDRIVVTATVNVQTSGNYRFTIGLTSSTGIRIAASTSSVLAQGTQQISVSFPATSVASLGVNGPYSRNGATLYADDVEQTPVTAFVDDAGATAAYLLSSLERPAIQFTGNNTVTGVDTNANGKFDILRIQSEVSVLTGGVYNWNASLRDSTGKGIEIVDSSAELVAGLNTITFDFNGTKIAQNGKDGPFTLSSVMLFSSQASTIVDELLKTQAFSVNDFECSGIVPPPIQSVTLTPATVIGGNSTRLRVNLTAPAGTCGAKIVVSSDNPAAIAAVIPTNVIVPAGQDFTELTIITSGVSATTQVTLTATSGVTSQSVQLTINPSSLLSLTLSAQSIQAGGVVTGTVTLDGAAPSGGTTISLSSSDPTKAVVPGSVTIPAGARSANFVITTNAAIEVTVPITITATSGSVTKNASFTIFAEVYINGSITAGGSPVTVTATDLGQNFLLAFDGAAGQRISLRLTDVTIGTSSCCGANVSIKKPDGSYLITPTAVGTTGKFIDAIVLPVAGSYTIVVDPVGTNLGSMTLTLFDVPPDFTANITPGGSPVSATLTVPGQNALLTFGGSVGQRVSLKFTAVTIDSSYLNIYKPDGTLLTNPTSFGTNGVFIDALTLPAAGTYTILVDPANYYTGAFTLTLYDVPPDVTGSITPGGSPVTVTTTVAGQKGFLTFGGTTGHFISLKISGVAMTGGSGYVDVSIVKPDGVTLVSAFNVTSSGSFIDRQTLPTTGTYTVVIAPRDSNVGSVTLTLYDVPADVTGTIVAGGSPVTVTTTVPGQNGQLSFNGTANQRITLNIGGVNMTGGNGYVDVSIKKPDGSQLAAVNFVASGGAFINTQTLPTTGAYSILINPQGSNIGSATLTLNDVSADVISTITPGGSPVTVTTTSVGQNAQVTFDGNSDQRVSLKISGVTFTGGNGYVDVYIKKPDGTTLASSSFINSSGGFIDTKTLPVTGTYTILVDPQGTNVGSVTLTLYDVPANVSGPIVPGGSSVSVTLTTPGQNAELGFTGTTNQRVFLRINGVSVTGGSPNWMTVSIRKPDGTSLVSTTVDASGGYIDTQTLPVDGAYIVLVDPLNTTTGSATLTLYNVPADIPGTITPGDPPTTVATSSPGQNVKLTFAGSANQRVFVRISDVSLTGGSPNWVNVAIKKPDGSTLISTTVDTSGGTIDTTVLPVTGTYSLVVDPANLSSGSVTVTLYDVPADLSGPIVPSGSSVNVATNTAGQNASYTFSGTVNQRISLNITNVSVTNGGFITVALRKPDGTSLGITSISSASGYLDLKVLPVAGTYSITVDPNSFNTASCTLTLYQVPADTTTPTTVNASAIEVSNQVPGQNMVVTFPGTAGQQVTIRVTNNLIGSVFIKLFKPDGTQQISFSHVSSSFNVPQQTLGTTGTYTILVDPFGSTTSSLNLRVTSP